MATIGTITQYGNGGYSTFSAKTTSYLGRASSDYRTYCTIPITWNSDKVVSMKYTAYIEVSNRGGSQTNTVLARLYTDESSAKSYSDNYIAEANGGSHTYTSSGIYNESSVDTTINFSNLNISSGTIYISLTVNNATPSGSNLLQAKTPTITVTTVNNSYTVTLDNDTGIDRITGAGSYPWGSSVTVTATPKDSHNFINWTGTSTSTNSSYTFTMPAKAVTLKANSAIKTFSVTVSGNDGISSVSGAGTYNYGSTANISATPIAGYHFTNWSGNSTSTSSSITISNITSNKNFIANAAPNSLTVIYDANGGKSYSSYTLPYTTTGTYESYNNGTLWNAIETFKLSKRGYHLVSEQEWNSKANGTGTTLGDDTSYSADVIASSAGKDLGAGNVTVTYYANWKPITYTVNYILNGGTTSHRTTETVAFNTSYTVMLESELSRNGYKFLGWTTNSDGTPDGLNWTEWDGIWTGVAGDADWGINANNTVTLYAIWEALANIYTKTQDGYKPGSPYVKVGTNWKKGTAVYVKVDGDWKLSTR